MSVAFAFGARTDQVAGSVSREAMERAYGAATRALYALSYLADEIAVEVVKANRLEARIDRMADRFPVGTMERGEAESVLASMRAAVKRKRTECGSLIAAFAEAWPVMGESWQATMIEGMPALAGAFALWVNVPDAGIWQTLRTVAGEGNVDACPF